MIQLPPPCLNIKQVDEITVLGVVVNNRMTATDHVAALLRSCNNLLYALRVLLRSHGLPQQSLEDVFSRHFQVYAAPALSGLCTAGETVSFYKCVSPKMHEAWRDARSTEEIFAMSDDQLFLKINSNSLHILQQLLDRPSLNY